MFRQHLTGSVTVDKDLTEGRTLMRRSGGWTVQAERPKRTGPEVGEGWVLL